MPMPMIWKQKHHMDMDDHGDTVAGGDMAEDTVDGEDMAEDMVVGEAGEETGVAETIGVEEVGEAAGLDTGVDFVPRCVLSV